MEPRLGSFSPLTLPGQYRLGGIVCFWQVFHCHDEWILISCPLTSSLGPYLAQSQSVLEGFELPYPDVLSTLPANTMCFQDNAELQTVPVN